MFHHKTNYNVYVQTNKQTIPELYEITSLIQISVSGCS